MPLLTLGQLTLGQSGSVPSMLLWIVVLIVVVGIGGFVIMNLRRRMLSNDDSISTGSSGLLDHLHQMHRSGEIDDQEFANARNAVLRQVEVDMEARKKPAEVKKPSILDHVDDSDLLR
tara:strand:- start:108758 stop:109111 length:354 start_codon:yes stop_codon:yes gene_type:complete